MNIDKFKHQHIDILSAIANLRQLVQRGIIEHATDISHNIVAMSSTIRLHLAVEDRVLYPALEASGNRTMAGMSQQYRDEMEGIAGNYLDFANKWNTPRLLAAEPETFRVEANRVLKALYERMKREDREFYPAIEAI
ncbi:MULTISPECIES: hemerythrin domain-containing protein [unclassified Duganella]|jgi:iron-sulfur cluster repair protein YtfE (RIC family)|uniref:hemerythrin domain-containing protein n=1 Tax=unclassified Duganella TaxID=2636909 RepID=UPI00087FDAEC|nr:MULTISPECIES: hemerythrin domain-containing protein [unclassified Duganella]SDF78080.1 Hemerythrin HHE cation binding domain-containing protein [Duganella sp. OV458]SDI50968.1 Hemerythrin HHE cation binding domain-containing protein [Duganella sp. OV510]